MTAAGKRLIKAAKQAAALARKVPDRITYYDDGLLDEIAVDATYVHLERMDKRCFFLLIGRPDGTEIALWMRTNKGTLGDFMEHRSGRRPPDTGDGR